MVGMVSDVIVHKYDTSFGEGGGGKVKKVSSIRVFAKNLGPTIDKDGMDTLSMVLSIVGRTCSDVVGPFES